MPHLSDRQITLLLILYVLGIAAWLLVNEVRVTLEDGFYYFGVAKHLAQGDGSTFDGFNPTNGYHPLWLLSLTPLFWIASTAWAALILGIILQALLMAGSVALLYHTVRLQAGQLAALLAALLWVLFTYPVGLGGLEFSLHALSVLAIAYIYLRWFEALPEQSYLYLVLGVVLSFTFLARLDTILLSSIIILWLCWAECKPRLWPAAIRRLLALGLPVTGVCLLYLGANLYLFGHLLPVSGVVKQHWSAYLLNQDPLYLKYGWFVAKLYHLTWPLRHLDQLYMFPLLLGSLGLTVLWLIGAFGPDRAGWRMGLAQTLKRYTPFILFGLLNFLSYVLLYHDYLSFPGWYFVIQPWLTAILLALFSDGIWQRWGRKSNRLALRWGVLAGLIGLGAGLFLYTVWSLEQWRIDDQQDTPPQPLYDAAAWARENLPADTIIGAWNAGAIGYLSERRVINLDGLINSWDYYQVERYDLCHYWQEMGVTYLVDIFDQRATPNQAVAPEPSYTYYARCANQLELVWADSRHQASWWRLQVYRIKP